MGMHLYDDDNTESLISDQDGWNLANSVLSVTIDALDNGGEDPSDYHITLWDGNTKLGETDLFVQYNVFSVDLTYTASSNSLAATLHNGEQFETSVGIIGVFENAFPEARLEEFSAM